MGRIQGAVTEGEGDLDYATALAARLGYVLVKEERIHRAHLRTSLDLFMVQNTRHTDEELEGFLKRQMCYEMGHFLVRDMPPHAFWTEDKEEDHRRYFQLDVNVILPKPPQTP